LRDTGTIPAHTDFHIYVAWNWVQTLPSIIPFRLHFEWLKGDDDDSRFKKENENYPATIPDIENEHTTV
jgi:hypothetical protein